MAVTIDPVRAVTGLIMPRDAIITGRAIMRPAITVHVHMDRVTIAAGDHVASHSGRF